MKGPKDEIKWNIVTLDTGDNNDVIQAVVKHIKTTKPMEVLWITSTYPLAMLTSSILKRENINNFRLRFRQGYNGARNFIFEGDRISQKPPHLFKDPYDLIVFDIDMHKAPKFDELCSKAGSVILTKDKKDEKDKKEDSEKDKKEDSEKDKKEDSENDAPSTESDYDEEVPKKKFKSSHTEINKEKRSKILLNECIKLGYDYKTNLDTWRDRNGRIVLFLDIASYLRMNPQEPKDSQLYKKYQDSAFLLSRGVKDGYLNIGEGPLMNFKRDGDKCEIVGKNNTVLFTNMLRDYSFDVEDGDGLLLDYQKFISRCAVILEFEKRNGIKEKEGILSKLDELLPSVTDDVQEYYSRTYEKFETPIIKPESLIIEDSSEEVSNEYVKMIRDKWDKFFHIERRRRKYRH